MNGVMKKKVLGSLLDSGAVSNLTLVMAQAEHELLTAAHRLDTAADLGTGISEPVAVKDRQGALKALLEALVSDSFEDVWMDEVGCEILDEPDRARQYLGIGADEFDAQITRWADSYRDAGAAGGDLELAEHHVRETFGVSLDTFADRVAGFDRGAEAERLFAGNFRTVRAVIDAATDAAEGGEP